MIREHATCIALDHRGVLLCGPSGAGKSDLALRLIDEGATLVGDDYVELQVSKNLLYAQAPSATAGKIEVRGLGIAVMPFLAQCPVALAVDLVAREFVPRLPEPAYRVYAGIQIPLLALNAFESSTPAKIRLAVRLGIEHIWQPS